MKFLFTYFLIIFFPSLILAQDIAFLEVSKTSNNKDRFLYAIPASEVSKAEYLATLEVRGFNKNDEEVFSAIYKKAKEVGANAFMVIPIVGIDEKPQPFSPGFYQLSLYYLADNTTESQIYVINTTDKPQNFVLNDMKIQLAPRSYIQQPLIPEKTYDLYIKKFLASHLKFLYKEHQPSMYFSVSGARIRANPYGSAGINFKSGDFTALENSYGSFLTAIYQLQP